MSRRFIKIAGYGGGIANSIYDSLDSQRFVTAKNLDVYSQQKILKPHVKMEIQVTDVAMSTAKIAAVLKASNGTVYGLGDSGSSNQLRLYKFGLNTATTTLSTVGTGGNNTAAIYGTSGWQANDYESHFHIVEAAGYILFWTGTTLSNMDLAGETYTADPYSWAHGGSKEGPLFFHEGQRRLFIAVDNKVYTKDSSTISGSADPILRLTFDDKYAVKSFTDYGRFVAIGLLDKYDSSTSKVAIYDGTATTVDDMIDVGDTGLQAIRNVNGIIHILCASVIAGFPGNYLRIYLSTSSGVVLADELLLDSAAEATQSRIISPIADSSVRVQGDRLYFCFKAYTQNFDDYVNITNGIYCYGKFEINQPRVLTIDRTTETSAANYSFTCLAIVDGGLLVCLTNGTNYFMEHTFHNTVNGERSANGVYETTAIPLNPTYPGLPGQIKRIYINHEPLPSSCGFTVAVKHYSGYPVGQSVVTDSFTDLITDQGDITASVGKTQSTDNATQTEVDGKDTDNNGAFDVAKFAQLRLSLDDVNDSSITAPGIIFPIWVEVEDDVSRP